MKNLVAIVVLIACSTIAMAQAEVHGPNDPNFSMKCKTGQYLRYTITSNENPYTVTVNGMKGENGNINKLEIPATVHYRDKDFAVTVINKGAFSNIDALVSVIIPKTVKVIRRDAFKNCSGLKTVKIGGTIEQCLENAFTGTVITKPIYTGKNLVYYPSSMKEYKINEGTEAILEYAFDNCKEMTSIVIPASVKKVFATSFSNCSKLTSIVVADANKTYDSRNNCNAIVVTAENKILAGCSSSLIPDGITRIGRIAFAHIPIQKIDIPNTVTAIEDSAFFQCELTTVTIPESITEIGASAFNKNKKLAVVNFNAINCKQMSKEYPAFAQCQALNSANFGDKVKVVPAFSFINCEELRYANLSNSVKEIGDMAFANCKMLSYFELPNSVEKIGEQVFYESGISEPVHSDILFAYFPNNYASEYSIPEGIKTIARKAFNYVTNLKSVKIPNSVTKIEEYAFSECKDLESVVMSISLETMETGAFKYSVKLKSINLPTTLKTIDVEIFMGCASMENIVIPNSVTDIKKQAFYDSGVKYITLPKSLNSIYVTALRECLNLKCIYIPKGSMSHFKQIMEPEFHSKLKEK